MQDGVIPNKCCLDLWQLHGAVSVTRGRHAIDSAHALRRIRPAHGDGCYPVIRSESPHTLRRLGRTTMSTSIELEGNDPLPILPSKPDPVALVRPTRFLNLLRYATSGDWLMNGVGIIMSMATGAARPLISLVFGALIDTFAQWEAQKHVGDIITADELAQRTAHITLYFLYLGVLTLLATYFFMAPFIYTGERQTFCLRADYLKAVLRQPVAFFDKDGISDKVPLACQQITMFVAGFAVAFSRSWRLALILTSVVPIMVLSGSITNLAVSKFHTRILSSYASAGSIAEEAITSVRTVTAFGIQQRVATRYNEELAKARKQGKKKAMVTGIGFGIQFGFNYFAYSLAFYYGYILLSKGEITAGNIVSVFFGVLIGSLALGQVAPDFQAFSMAKSAGAKLFQTIDIAPKIDPYDRNGKLIPESELKGHITFKDVQFAYPSRPGVVVLDGFKLDIKAGTTVAVVGASGGGKSTIVQLIERFYDPDSGTVALDGIPLTDLNLSWLRSQIGLVSQEPVLFDGTVSDNISLGFTDKQRKEMSQLERHDRIVEACKLANAHGFVMKLPQGYDSEVGERGGRLSGGQKQRIAIARAILSNPRILLLDEATSALDTASERIVQAALDAASKSRTTVVVAHRLSTVKNADRIIVLERGGHVIEDGTHVELIRAGGVYAEMVRSQQIASADRVPQPSEPLIETFSVNPVQAQDERIDAGVRAPQTVASQDVTIELTDRQPRLSSWKVLSYMFRMNRPELTITIPAFLAASANGLVYPAFAIIFATIIQLFAQPGPNTEHDANMMSLAFLLLGIATVAVTAMQNGGFGVAGELLTERIRQRALAAILRQDSSFFDYEEHSVGALTASLARDAQQVQGASGAILATILQVIVNLVACVTVSVAYGWKLALVGVCGLPLMIGSGLVRVRILAHFSEKSKEAYARSAQVACESVAAIRAVQSLSCDHDRYVAMLDEPFRDGVRNATLGTWAFALSQSMIFLVNSLVFWYGGRLIAYEGYQIDQMMVVFIALVFGSTSAGRAFGYAPDLYRAKDSGEAIIRLLEKRPLIDSDSPDGIRVDPKTVRGSIEFRNVAFCYPLRPTVPVLRGIDLDVKPGQFVALVGPSGSGKSTVVSLIERFYNVTGGSILVDGVNIADLHLSSYRSAIGIVSQEPSLFAMLTIGENVAYGAGYADSLPTQSEIEASCKEANIHDFIMSLPNGYNTPVGARGTQLSGGQKQRIAIARALIRQPRILLLDEATSALDPESERVVQEALDKAARGRTTVAIAHRLSAIQNADVIFVFQNGMIVESGNHADLFAKRGLYHDLVVEQNINAP
ncbi:ABC transporter transmembrane region [Plasmodiophora brassicae]